MNILNIKLFRSQALFVLGISILILNVLKFWADYTIGLNHQILTLIQTILPLLFIFLLFKNISTKISTIIAWAFIFYHIIRGIAELSVISSTDASLDSMMPVLFSLLRVLLIFSLFMLLCMKFRKLTGIIVPLNLYLVYSTIFSILQLPMSPVSDILVNFGGNLTSGNGLGLFRSNGGLAGTVIMYSNYLLATFLLLFYKEPNNGKTQIFLWLVFFIAVFLCFSRSLFLSIFIILFFHVFFKKPILFVLIGFLIIIVFYLNLNLILEQYKLMVGQSDSHRIESWVKIIENYNFFTLFMGQETGANTGFKLEGYRKITADGFLLAWYYDFGIIGLVLFLALMWLAVLQTGLDLISCISIFIAIVLMMFVNSGFEKSFIIFIYFFTLIVLKERDFSKCLSKSV